MRKPTFLILLLILTFKLAAQDEPDEFSGPGNRQISLEFGGRGGIIPNNEAELFGGFTRVQFTNYFYRNWGYRTGLGVTTGLPYCKGLYSVPLQLCFRTGKFAPEFNPEEAASFGESMLYSFLNLLPMSIEMNAGLNLGYANVSPFERNPQTGLAYHREFYAVSQNVFAALNFGSRFNFHLGPIALFFYPQIDYSPTRNFYYYSDYGRQKGNASNWFFEVSGGLGVEF